MNIVKGVAGLIRRTSGYGGEFGIGSPSHRFPVPSPKIQFSDIGDEAILSTLWQRYQSISDKAERQKAFHIFLKQFLVIYKNWEPSDMDNSSEAASSSVSYGDDSQNPDEVVIGCSAAHPAEIIVVLIEEVTHITSMVTECLKEEDEVFGLGCKEVCGNRTELCHLCNKYIRLREKVAHDATCNGVPAEIPRANREAERDRRRPPPPPPQDFTTRRLVFTIAITGIAILLGSFFFRKPTISQPK